MKLKMEMKMLHLIACCLPLVILTHGQQQDQNPGFISIDCGAPTNYHDTNLNIYYNNDDGFVDSGTPIEVSSTLYNPNKYDRRSKNMRVFENGTRNCYTLRPHQGKGHKYLVRASFWYGNYDGKNQIPVFLLHIDVNYWATVNSSSYIYEEIIYTPSTDYIQVCLVNIGLGVPFISAIELRLLNDSMYDVAALVTNWRFNLGSHDTYRHPEDEYDRIWRNYTYDAYPSVSNTTDILTSTSINPYKVPPQVLMTAAQTTSVDDSFFLQWPSDKGVSDWYVYYHFAELEEQNGKIRDMTIYEAYVTSVQTARGVHLENRKPVTEAPPPGAPMSGPYINFTINATAKSDLPPLLNAIEIFIALKLPNSSSYLDDVNAIYDIKKAYSVMRADWQGDPCIPRDYSWSGLNCSSDTLQTRIISLNLSNSRLAGEIRASFSKFTAIGFLDLSNNHLNGSVPEFFAKISSLQYLNLSGNDLSGPIPPTLLKKAADGTLNLSFDGNPNLVTAAKKEMKSGVIAAIVSASVIVLILMSILTLLWRIKKKKSRGISWGNINGTLRASKNQTFTSSEILNITEDFKTNIGEGGFGKVYFGKLVDGTQVAVKIPSQSSKQGYSEFENEVNLLMVLNHKNLVTLLGYCDEFGNTALVYEFMSNGSVRQHLSEHSQSVLSWNQRVQIAADTAQGLEYLHNGCKPPIVHRDLKTTNILLNENLRAKIADFGLSKAFASEHDTHISTRPAGTPGYLDPEFHSSGNLNKKSDVYSFGIVLFELVTGKSAIIRSEIGTTHILNWVTPHIQCGDIQSIIDPRLGRQFDLGSAWKLIEIAMSCVPTTAIGRPDMSRILSDVKECVPVEVAFEISKGMETSISTTSDPSGVAFSDVDAISPR